MNAITRCLVVTIDGAAGTGKTTVAQELARRLGTDCLDTGAMYRAVAVLAIEQGIDPTDGKALARTIQKIGIRFDWEKQPPAILLGGRDVSKRIRDLEISNVVSIVAKQAEVRKILVDQQRAIGKSHPLLVTEGRDQGSIVFPDAPVQFFLKAEMNERTQRRVQQLRESGSSVDVTQVKDDILARDRLDTTRDDDPLICPKDAIMIDTSDKTVMEVADLMEEAVNNYLST